MKFDEAIEMILDGGKTYLTKNARCELYFDENSKILCQGYDDTGHIEAPYLFKDELSSDNWIVEKDRIIYEEYTDVNAKQCEKVELDNILFLIDLIVGAGLSDIMSYLRINDYKARKFMQKENAKALEAWSDDLKKKLEYLISLQEK